MTDRTAAALASALPAGVDYTGPQGEQYSRDDIAGFLLRELESRGWRLVHADDRPQTFTEHYAQALALIHDHVEASDAD
jgi:hypothetical protein